MLRDLILFKQLQEELFLALTIIGITNGFRSRLFGRTNNENGSAIIGHSTQSLHSNGVVGFAGAVFLIDLPYDIFPVRAFYHAKWRISDHYIYYRIRDELGCILLGNGLKLTGERLKATVVQFVSNHLIGVR